MEVHYETAACPGCRRLPRRACLNHHGSAWTSPTGAEHATEIGADPAYAERSATFAVSKVPRYRTTPLRALWQHPPYFHDGSAPTLQAVIERYNARLLPPLTDAQKLDLLEFLKSL